MIKLSKIQDGIHANMILTIQLNDYEFFGSRVLSWYRINLTMKNPIRGIID